VGVASFTRELVRHRRLDVAVVRIVQLVVEYIAEFIAEIWKFGAERPADVIADVIDNGQQEFILEGWRGTWRTLVWILRV